MTNLSKPWSDALARHMAAANAYAETARSVTSDSWTTPLGEGKWSPAQVTEHLNRSYQVVIGEMRGGTGIRVRAPWLLRQILRQTVLRSIYRKRQLPGGARAPSEIMPKVVDGTQAQLVERFTRLASEFCDAVLANRDQPERRLTHHVFGAIDLLRGIDFIAIHVEHHHRQIAGKRK